MRPLPYSDADRPARVPVWNSLAALWLDTEMSASGAHHLVRVLLASPYSVGEAEAIHWHEVAPAVYGNRVSVAGEWAGFDEDWLAEQCAAAATRRRPAWWRAGRTRALRALAGDLPDVVFERARRAEREGLPPIPSGPFVSLLVSEDPIRHRVPW